MYRECNKCKKCSALNSNYNNYGKDVLENICDDVPVTSDFDYNNCGCGFDEEDNIFPSNPMFGQSYVPWQTLTTTFTPCVGLKMGTIFPELVSPYTPLQSMEQNAYIAANNKIGEGCNKC